MLAISLTPMILVRNKNLKTLALTTLVTQVLGGAGEPMMFGIIFRYQGEVLIVLLHIVLLPHHLVRRGASIRWWVGRIGIQVLTHI